MVRALAVALPEPARPAATQSDDAYLEAGGAEISVVHKDLCMSPFDSGRDEAPDPQNVIPAKQAVSKRHCCEAQTPEIVIPAKQAVSKRYCCEAQTPEIVIPAKQAVSKRYCCEAQTPEIVIPAKAGIQGGLGAGVPHNTKASSGLP